MSCKNPLVGYVYGVDPETGRKKIRIIKNNIEYLEDLKNNKKTSDIDKINNKNRILIPCGQCIDCRLQYSRQWANRLMLEKQTSSSAYFITLTYDNAHLPLVSYGRSSANVAGTLSKRDVQLFMKRLRKAMPDCRLRYYLAGEYGSSNGRPHYHLILFNAKLDDLVLTGTSELGFPYFWSNTIARAWSTYVKDGASFPAWFNEPCNVLQRHCWTSESQNKFYTPFGLIQVCDVDWECCAYVARYVTKKLTGDMQKFYDTFGLEPEFCLMSRNPGIGYQWYKEHPDLYDFDYINIGAMRKGVKFRPPRFYDKLYELEHPEDMAKIKAARSKVTKELQKAKLASTDLSYFELLQLEEAELENKVKSLERRLDNGT